MVTASFIAIVHIAPAGLSKVFCIHVLGWALTMGG